MATRDKVGDDEDISWSSQARKLLAEIQAAKKVTLAARLRAQKAKAELQRLEKLANERIARMRQSVLLNREGGQS